MSRLAILGASGHGKVVADAAELCGWAHIDFFDDAWPSLARNGLWPVVGDGSALLNDLSGYDGVVVAIGNNDIRQQKTSLLIDSGATLVSIQHPSAVISQYAKLGLGSVVMAGSVINVDTIVGSGAIINTGATVDHDCVLGDFVHVSPGAHLAGGVVVGDSSWIGVGASVKQQICIGRQVIVGAGAVVVSDISDELTVIGVPAKSIR